MEKSKEVEKIEFLSLSPELIDANILAHLNWNDLLRLRRVCKLTKSITENYLKVHPELAPEIEINDDDKTFEKFFKMNIPTTKIFLNNPSGNEFYQQAGTDADKFLEQFGSKIKYLRVDQISVFIYGKEWDFLDALMNLQSFEARHYGCGKPVNPSELNKVLEEKFTLGQDDPRFAGKNSIECSPKVLKLVKRLKIGNNETIHFSQVFGYTVAFLAHGQNLEYVSLPFPADVSELKTFIPDHFLYPLSASFFYILFNLEDQKTADVPIPLKNLNIIDFSSYPANFAGVSDDPQLVIEYFSFQIFLNICHYCVKRGVKLMNVPSHWFMRREEFPVIDSPEFGELLVSLVNLHPAVLSMQLSNLERVQIQMTSRSSPGSDWREKRRDWPSLKSLDITVDGKISSYWILDTDVEGEESMRYPSIETERLFQFFFYGVTRGALTEIRLNFVEETGSVAVPSTEDIVTSCPNLKKLTIINWPGTNEALAKLWNGLPELEEVSLEYCKHLGDEAFVGEDQEAPVFLKLTKLRKLALKGLDQMPKITDTLFSLVIRNMELAHFTLTSDDPVNMVTKAGIQSLLGGKFGKSIERFPFRDWSLENVSVEDFKKIEEDFRSFYMM